MALPPLMSAYGTDIVAFAAEPPIKEKLAPLSVETSYTNSTLEAAAEAVTRVMVSAPVLDSVVSVNAAPPLPAAVFNHEPRQ